MHHHSCPDGQEGLRGVQRATDLERGWQGMRGPGLCLPPRAGVTSPTPRDACTGQCRKGSRQLSAATQCAGHSFPTHVSFAAVRPATCMCSLEDSLVAHPRQSAIDRLLPTSIVLALLPEVSCGARPTPEPLGRVVPPPQVTSRPPRKAPDEWMTLAGPGARPPPSRFRPRVPRVPKQI